MRKIIIFFTIISLSSTTLFGQNGNIKINQSNKLDSIIKLKKELNSKIQNLRIQIYSGDRDNAEQMIKEFIEIFNQKVLNPSGKIILKNLSQKLKKINPKIVFYCPIFDELDSSLFNIFNRSIKICNLQGFMRKKSKLSIISKKKLMIKKYFYNDNLYKKIIGQKSKNIIYIS